MAQRSVLITGCSSGIGRHVAEGLARRGYRVFATARKQADVDTLNGVEGLESLLLDLDDSASIKAAVDAILQRTDGRVFALFNNGGYGQPGAVEDLRREVMRAQFETLVFGWLELTNRVLPAMRSQGEGRIIQNSSVLGLITLPFRGAYSAAKFAIEGMTDTLRLELHGTGVHVSLIEPGPILSRFRAHAMEAFARNIDPSHSPWRDTYAAMQARLKKSGAAAPFTLPPEAVLARVVHALEANRPKARYYVTLPTHVFAYLRRILPTPALDWILRQTSRAELKTRGMG
jgi:NAD(P)-dependent dehydrogenase (short-subunit alcohol dehydrogenase family)